MKHQRFLGRAAGEPVGWPWHSLRTPLVRIVAVTEDQTDNPWTPLLEMARGRSLSTAYGLEVLRDLSAAPRDFPDHVVGDKRDLVCFASLDQTDEWKALNGDVKLAKLMRFNAAKLGGSLIETPNA
ncbi:hypothetical protein [Streptomyces afghaniensis]|uniref:hypothetical protein n=1 Tax=Streptomyces afghaniensis TaxID=66865 RepID=UPI003791D004